MFRDCISDDLIYIHQFKESSIDNKKINYCTDLCISSLCRSYITTFISSIEYSINYSGHHYISLAENYTKELLSLISSPKEKLYTNQREYTELIEQKISRFYSFSKDKDFPLKEDFIYGFIALKNIRNALTHMSWRNVRIKDKSKAEIERKAKQAIVTNAGFPINLMTLNHDHWKKITDIEQAYLMFLNGNPVIEKYQNKDEI